MMSPLEILSIACPAFIIVGAIWYKVIFHRPDRDE